jgi:hypothetical protein
LLSSQTFTSTRLKLDGFKGPFITHGIDLVADPQDRDSVYIHAINHLPHPDYNSSGSSSSDSGSVSGSTSDYKGNKARSQIEVFHHTLHPKSPSSVARHIRSIHHPLIRTPNDIYSIAPGEFLVTNDHKHREHGLRRTFEDVWTGKMAHVTETVHVRVDLDLDLDLEIEGKGGVAGAVAGEKRDGEDGVKVTLALEGMHNNNGLGHGDPKKDKEVLVCDAAGGVLHLARLSSSQPSSQTSSSLTPSITKKLELVESIQMDSTIDNPSYFHDPYPGNRCDASGYVLAGLLRGADYGKFFRDEGHVDPSVVWHVSRSESKDKKEQEKEAGDRWTRRIVFQDDGETLSSASTAVVLPIDPATNGGRKEAWIWVTGPSSKAVVAAKIDLVTLC